MNDVEVPFVERGNRSRDYFQFVEQPYAEHEFITKEREFLAHLSQTSSDETYRKLKETSGITREILAKTGRGDLYDSVAWFVAYRNNDLQDIMQHLSEKTLQAQDVGERSDQYKEDLLALKRLCRGMMYDLGISDPSQTAKSIETHIDEKTPDAAEKKGREITELLNKDPREYYRSPFRKEMLPLGEVWQSVRLVKKPVFSDGEEHDELFIEYSFSHADWRRVPTRDKEGDPLTAQEATIADSIERTLRLSLQEQSNVFQDKRYYVSQGLSEDKFKDIKEWMDHNNIPMERLERGIGKQDLITHALNDLAKHGVNGQQLRSLYESKFNNLLGIGKGFDRSTVFIKGDHGWSGRATVMDAAVAQAYAAIDDGLTTVDIVGTNSKLSRRNVFVVTSDNMGIYPHDEPKVKKNPYVSEPRYLDFGGFAERETPLPRFTPSEYGETITEQDMNLVFGMLGVEENGDKNTVLELCWSFGGMAGIEAHAHMLTSIGATARLRISKDLQRLTKYYDEVKQVPLVESDDDEIKQQNERVKKYRAAIEQRMHVLVELLQVVVPKRTEMSLHNQLPDYRTVAFTPAHEDTSIFLGVGSADGDLATNVHAKSSATVLSTGGGLHYVRATRIPVAQATLKGIASFFTGWRLIPPENSAIAKIGREHALNFATPHNAVVIGIQKEGLLKYQGLSKNALEAVRSDQLPLIPVYAGDDRLLGYSNMMRAWEKVRFPGVSLVFNNGSGHSVLASDEFRQDFPYDIFALTPREEWSVIQDTWKDIAGLRVGSSSGKPLNEYRSVELKRIYDEQDEFNNPRVLERMSDKQRLQLQQALLRLEEVYQHHPKMRDRVIASTRALTAHMM